MNKIFLAAIILTTGWVNAQNVGINSTNPLMTFDVNGIAATASTVDGIRAPRITLAQLNLKTGYNTNHTGALLYVTDVAGGSTVTATAQVTTAGYYFFDGTTWQSVVSKAGSAVFIASLGNGNGSTTAATISATAFNTVPLTTVSKNVGGGVWNTTNYTYTVPNSGTYLIKSSVRLVDGSVARNVFQAVHTSNADIPEGIWDTNSGNRWTMLYTRIAYFNKNDVLRLYVYSDGAVANISDASLNIILLTQN
jgi:hypothetical protein